MRKRNFPDNITEIQKWRNLDNYYRNNKSIVGTIKNYSQYFGFTVDVDGINAKMSIGELSYWRNEEPEKFVGNDFSFIITEIDTYRKTLSVSRKKLVSNAKAGDILNGFIIDIEDNFITVDVGFACRILKRNLRNHFVKSIDDHFKFYSPIKLVLLNDFEKLKYTFSSTKESDVWNFVKGKYKENDIVSASILSISDTRLMLDVDDIVKAFVYRANLSEELTTRLSEGSLSIGEYIDVAISKHKDEHHTIECSVRLLDKIKSQEMVNTFNSINQRGYIYEAEIIDIQKKYAKIKLGEYEGYIEKDSVSWNDIEEIEDILYVGQIVKVVYLADNKDKLTFGIKQLNPQPYDEILYNLDLMGLLNLANVPTTDFIGIARIYGKYTFIEKLYSYGEIEGKLLVDPFYGYNLRAIVMNADNVEAGKYYKIKLINLPPKTLRVERNQLFQFQCKIIEEVENPYNKDIDAAFQRNLGNPTSNKRDAHLLKEIADVHSSKDRMFYELIQNADDAAPKSSGVSIMSFTTRDYLVFCHNGFSFDRFDFEAITSAAVGTKKANENKTGYKGIGFKSVFRDSNRVYISTNGYNFKFDKEDTQFCTFDGFYRKYQLIKSEGDWEWFCGQHRSVKKHFDGVNDIPWQLEPIHITEFPTELGASFSKYNVSIAIRLEEKNIEGNSGYKAVIDSIINNPKFMLFLRKTDRIKFNERTISREVNGGIITLKNSFAQNKVERYERFDFTAKVSNEIFEEDGIPIRIKIEEREDDGNIRKAFFVDLDGSQIENIPMKIAISSSTELSFAIPVNEDGSISILENNTISMFAFLPTLVKDFVFPFYINANFILDPPRQRVLGDCAWNLYLFKILAEKIVDWSIELSKRNDRNALNILPYKKFDESSSDISLLAKSFNEAYLSAISNKAFILNEEGKFAKQEGIIIDNSGLSEKISHEDFYKILGISKRLPNSSLDFSRLEEDIFGIEKVTRAKIYKILTENIENVRLWISSTNDELQHLFFTWLALDENSTEIVSLMPLIQFGNQWLSIKELINKDNYIVSSLKTIGIKEVLSKLGFVCSDTIKDTHPLAENITTMEEKNLFALIKGKDTSMLSFQDRLHLVECCEHFDNVGEAAIANWTIFKNQEGSFVKMASMVAYREDIPKWLHPYMLNKDEYSEKLNKFLVKDDSILSTIVEPNISEILNGVDVYEIYSYFKNRWTNDLTLKLIKLNVSNIISLVEVNPETQIPYIQSLDALSLNSSAVYSDNTQEYKIIKIASSDTCCINLLRSKITIDGIALSSISLKDEFHVQYNNKKYEFHLSKILTTHSDSLKLSNVAKNFSNIAYADIIFAQKESDPIEVYRNLFSNTLTRYAQLNVEQFCFLMLIGQSSDYNNISFSALGRYIRVGDEQWFLDVMDYCLDNELGDALSLCLRTPNIIYPCGSLMGKFIDSDDYTLAPERVPEFINNWVDSNEKKKFLKKLGVHGEEGNDIQRRVSFMANKIVNEYWNISDGKIIISFFNWVKNSIKLPVNRENQITILEKLFDVQRINREYREEDFVDSSEWTNELYLAWKKDSGVSIKIISGLLPYRGIYAGVHYFSANCGEYIYFKESNTIYISSNKEPASILTDVYADRTISVFNQSDWNKIFLVSANLIKDKDDEIAELKKRIEDLSLQKDNTCDSEVENPGNKYNRGNLSPEQRKQVNLEACEQAYNYLRDIDGYDCSEWDYLAEGRVVKSVLYNGRQIVVVITSSGGGYIHLNPYAFAQLMENPKNLLINVCGNKVRTYSFKELFEENPDVNLVFDSKVVTPKIFAELANKFLTSERTCFVIANPNYSASDEIKGFGLNEKMEGGKVITFSSENQIW